MSLDKIVNRLYDWRKERHIGTDGQMAGLYKNVLEELDEFSVAKNDFEKIDALCDICVFCFNSLGELARNKKLIAYNQGERRLINIQDKITNADEIFKKAKALISINCVDTWRERYKEAVVLKNQFLDLAWEVISACAYDIEALGFDFKKSMNETLKEIESRTGHWDEEQKKFIKDNRGSYVANYEKCKRSAE